MNTIVSNNPQANPPISGRDHVSGSETAAVTLLEYGDYECSYCGRVYPVIKALQQRLQDTLRVAYRHFPLSTVHPHAERAAEVAEAAGARGKFWEMYDMLFTHQHALDDRHLLAYAAEIGLDPATVNDELASRVHAPRVREDFVSGVRSGVNGTPSFFIQGLRYDGPHDFTSLLAAVTRAAVVARAP